MMTFKKFHFVLMTLLAVLLSVALGIVWFKYKQVQALNVALTAKKVAAELKPALTVDLVKLSALTISQNLAANGSIAPWQEAMIGAEVNGLMLSRVNVNVGDYVKRGQVLAEFSVSTLQADIEQEQANLAEAKAAAIEAKDNANRARSIQDSGALSAQQVEQLITLEATSSARVAAAAATLQSQQIRFKQTKVYAPDDGIISARTATVGAVSSPGQELFKLIRQGRLEWRAELTSSDISKIKNGLQANISLPDGSNITGKVRSVSPMVDSQTRNAMVFVTLPSNSQAKAGMFARGNFVIGEAQAQTLPASALVLKDGFAYVMQVDAKNRVKQLKVQAGSRQGVQVEVLGLPTPNGQYVAAGGAFLADGDRVNVAGRSLPADNSASKPINKN
jgi:HlyD family secretion protein